MFDPLAQATVGDAFTVVLILVAVVIALAGLLFFFTYGFLYFKALLAGAHVGIFEIIGMRLRGVPPGVIVESRIMAEKAGLQVPTAMLEVHHLAGGSVQRVVNACIAAQKAGIDLAYEQACAADLAGRDPLEATGSDPRTEAFDEPDPSRGRE